MKLVRDKIPELIKRDNKIPIFYIADDQEYYSALKNKLSEELEEFLESENVEELADLIEVIYAIVDFRKIERIELEDIRIKKVVERGAFKNKFILKEVKWIFSKPLNNFPNYLFYEKLWRNATRRIS